MRYRTASLLAAGLLLAAGPAAAHEPPPGMGQMRAATMPPMPQVYAGEADKPGAPVFQGLGAHHHPISTRVPRAPMFFNQGVNLLFGFNHAEAIYRESLKTYRADRWALFGLA